MSLNKVCIASQVLGAKERPSPAALASWAPLAAALTHKELAATVLPAAQRSVRRNPDSALPALVALLGALQLDLSRYVAELFAPLLLLQCRHAKDTVRWVQGNELEGNTGLLGEGEQKRGSLEVLWVMGFHRD